MARMDLLRRALAEFARDANRGAHLGFAAGAGPAAVEELTDDEEGADAGRVIGQGLTGVLLGVPAGAGAGMAIRSGVNLARGARNLREALAARMAGGPEASPMTPSSVERIALLGDDAGADTPLLQELRASRAAQIGRRATPNPAEEMEELSAARRILARLKGERRTATDAEEIADLDEQIAELQRLLGM